MPREMTATRQPDNWYIGTGRTAKPVPAVNPYAVIALAAALLGLFPVAIVFGLIAFSYPGGRRPATAALLLGLLEVGAVVAVVMAGGTLIDRFTTETSGTASTSSVVVPPIVLTPAPTAIPKPPVPHR